jgi:hypothetical protein
MIGMSMGVQDVFNTESFCFDQGQQFVFVSSWIDNNGIAVLGAGHYICKDLKRLYRDLMYNDIIQIQLFYK